jgi:hypothetical protein
MSEFEFLSVLISIIFGLGLTHVLSGSLRYILARARQLELRRVPGARVPGDLARPDDDHALSAGGSNRRVVRFASPLVPVVVLQYTLIAAAATFVRSAAVHRAISGWFVSSIAARALVVHRLLA